MYDQRLIKSHGLSVTASRKNLSLLAGSPVGLKSKRFVFEILLARENRREGTGEEGEKGEPVGNPRVFEYQPTSRPTTFDITQSVTSQNQANHNRLKM